MERSIRPAEISETIFAMSGSPGTGGAGSRAKATEAKPAKTGASKSTMNLMFPV
jgi:hypothetical protein